MNFTTLVLPSDLFNWFNLDGLSIDCELELLKYVSFYLLLGLKSYKLKLKIEKLLLSRDIS